MCRSNTNHFITIAGSRLVSAAAGRLAIGDLRSYSNVYVLSSRHLQQYREVHASLLYGQCASVCHEPTYLHRPFSCTLIWQSWRAIEFVRSTDNTDHYHAHIGYKGKPKSNIFHDNAFHRMYRVSPHDGELRKEMDIK